MTLARWALLTWVLTPNLLFGKLAPLQLEGFPLQMEWADIDGDGRLDLTALMTRSQTEGELETYFVAGRLRGIYEDKTVQEKYLLTLIQGPDGWVEQHRLELGRETVLGFAIGEEKELVLWKSGVLIRHRLLENRWQPYQNLDTPGILAGETVFLSEFPFWKIGKNGPVWLVPDVNGIHLTTFQPDLDERFLAYPAFVSARNHTDEKGHHIELNMPSFVSLDGDAYDELVFQGEDRAMGWSLDSRSPPYEGHAEGVLVDLNGDGLADLIQSEEEGDIERLKDLPKVQSRIRTYLAKSPLVFESRPQTDQLVPGFILAAEDSDITLADPFLDINGDGLKDLLGVAFKFSWLQVTKLVTTGRFKLKFLLFLIIQKPDGSFSPLAGNPFPMVWKLNLRRLKMPEFAQITADFDGDGWLDILVEKDTRLEITRLDGAGIPAQPTWKVPIPTTVRDPDQVFGRDLTGDGRDEFILVKIQNRQTRLEFVEYAP